MSSTTRTVVVVAVAIWTLGTLGPKLTCIWSACPSNGILSVGYDGVIRRVAPDSPAARASLVPGDRVAPPMPSDLFRDPPPPLTLRILHHGTTRIVTIAPKPTPLTALERTRFLGLAASYLIFLVVGSGLLLLRPSAMTWSFYLYCVLRYYGDLGFYWPGSSGFFWFNALAFASLGGASCALVTVFALLFPRNRADGWRKPLLRVAVALVVLFPLAWLSIFVRVSFLGLPSQSLVNLLVLATSLVYLVASGIFIITLVQSRGDERQRLRWILIFPVVLILRIAGINVPFSMPPWFSDVLLVLAVFVPISVAYAVARRRVFDVQFAISRALIYAMITTIIAGTFLLLDWFMSKQFAETRFTLTAEIILALAIGSWLNMLHRNVDRLVDSTFFRQRHRAQERLTKAAAAVLRSESRDVVDRFLVHEPVRAFDLTSASLFHRDDANGQFFRTLVVGSSGATAPELTSDDPLVLHLLSEGAPVRLADVVWTDDASRTQVGDALLAMPVLLRDQLVAIVLYGPHHSGADIDPDEVKSMVLLVERAGAAYDHIEARTLRAQVESLVRERDAKQREIELLRAGTA